MPAGLLHKGENLLAPGAPKENDEILVGMIRIDPRPLRTVTGEASLAIDVVESTTGSGVPCRITIIDDLVDALPPLTASPGQRLAVRPGVVYTGDGHARVSLPAGRYRVHAGRGPEFSIASSTSRSTPATPKKSPSRSAARSPTANLVACDTHIHTLTFSGHGDATDDERAITLAGEGLELPVATEHNQINGYAAAAGRMGLLSRFTPVLAARSRRRRAISTSSPSTRAPSSRTGRRPTGRS